jgi:glycerol-3-phosphate dehydrogenase
MRGSFDVAVLGGGINGCGIAAEAAMRGLSVILIEKDDLASKTSSSSSKLIHGGLRYLEQYDFALVKKSLDERQTLLNLAPHLVYPLPFVLPYLPSMRPFWLLKTGLFFYNHLSFKNKLKKSKTITRSKNSDFFIPLSEDIMKGFLFYDCATDDSRLTISNAIQAKEYGANIYTRTELLNAKPQNDLWQLLIKPTFSAEETIQAKVIINATGPWVEKVNQKLEIPSQYHLSLVKGSHLVFKQLYQGDQAYLLQNMDKRVVFVTPFHGYTLVGTTDVPFSEDLDSFGISYHEIEYLLKLINFYFKKQLNPEDIIHCWSGVRPLISMPGHSPQSLNRGYAYNFVQKPAPAISIYGGKITTYRQLSKEIINQLKPVFPTLKASISDVTPLPGAKLGTLSFSEYKIYAKKKYSWLEASLLDRLLNTYGSKTELILQDCHQLSDLGIHFGQTLFQKEVDYLLSEEWASDTESILWRRTKLGLSFHPSNIIRLKEYLESKDPRTTIQFLKPSEAHD